MNLKIGHCPHDWYSSLFLNVEEGVLELLLVLGMTGVSLDTFFTWDISADY